jgi:hypothetical protein
VVIELALSFPLFMKLFIIKNCYFLSHGNVCSSSAVKLVSISVGDCEMTYGTVSFLCNGHFSVYFLQQNVYRYWYTRLDRPESDKIEKALVVKKTKSHHRFLYVNLRPRSVCVADPNSGSGGIITPWIRIRDPE